MKPKVTHYLRFRDLLSSATSTSTAPDAIDDCRAVNIRAMKEMLDYITFDEDDDETAVPVDTTDLPPID